MLEVRQLPGQQIVGDNDGVAFGQQSIAQVRAQEAGSASHQGALLVHDFLSSPGERSPACVGEPSGSAGARPTL